MTNRWEFPERLLLYGNVDTPESDTLRNQELIVAIDLRDGRMQSWNVTLDTAGERP